MKISIIGAGNVGATLAKRIVESNLADVVLLDIAKNIALGKALDLMHSAPAVGFTKTITGTDAYADTANSDIIVVTAGFPRQPGMKRSDLIKKNGAVIKEVVGSIKKTSPGALLIMVTNPLDLMTYLAYKESGFKRERVMGMAGTLDQSRFTYIIANELKKDIKDIETLILGQHGIEMVPVISHTRVKGQALDKLLSKDKIENLKKESRESGAKLVNLLGKGSAYYAPSAAIFTMIKSIIGNKKDIIGVSCLAQGEYGIKDICIGLPVRLGKNGIEEIVTLKLTKEELDALKKAADTIKELLTEL